VAKLKDEIVVCGGLEAPRKGKAGHTVRLNLIGDDANVDVEIVNISRRLSTDVPEILTDLVEIASYVYCADQVVTRGGEGVLAFGAEWRRTLRFRIPVRHPEIWSSDTVTDALKRTLSFLSDDEYEFSFQKQTHAVPMQRYLKFGDGDAGVQTTDEVLLFSGGLDSLGGAVQALVNEKRHVALVSHRSNPKTSHGQERLVEELSQLSPCNRPLHVPVWVNTAGINTAEYTQRSRSFLYASLAFAVSRIFGLDRIRFYENGVVSLNLPISEQAVGARATRTTHPKVLGGLADLFSQLIDRPFVVENPFLWHTRAEVVNVIGDAGCSCLIQHSVSCMHTRDQTKDHPHCGQCSQCVGRRFATLASNYGIDDPASRYKIDLLEGERRQDKDLTLLESFIRTATDIERMTDAQLIGRYGEMSRALRHLPPLTANAVANRVIRLHRQHAREVTHVMDTAIKEHASDIRAVRLPKTCGIVLALAESCGIPTLRTEMLDRASGDAAIDQPEKSVFHPVATRLGRRANVEANRRIASIIEHFGSEWKNRLLEVCDALETENEPLPTSGKWQKLGCSDWADVLATDPEGLVKALQHRLDWVLEHHLDNAN